MAEKYLRWRTLRCSQCQHQVRTRARYCWSCGAPFIAAVPHPPSCTVDLNQLRLADCYTVQGGQRYAWLHAFPAPRFERQDTSPAPVRSCAGCLRQLRAAARYCRFCGRVADGPLVRALQRLLGAPDLDRYDLLVALTMGAALGLVARSKQHPEVFVLGFPALWALLMWVQRQGAKRFILKEPTEQEALMLLLAEASAQEERSHPVAPQQPSTPR